MARISSTIASVFSLTALALSCSVALAQSYPSKTIEWVVPYPAGGGTDTAARTLASHVAATLGQTVLINNKPGAATNIGADYTARAKADGYVIMSADTATLAANPYLYRKLSYNAATDFAPVGLTVRFPMVLAVHPDVPATNLKEFMDWAREQKSADYATPGAGSPHHLATELFREKTGLALTHIPYRGAAPAVQDVVGGQVPFMFVDTASGQHFLTSGRLRAIGVASPERIKGFENIPTLQEQGLEGFEAFAWQGIVAPKGTPDEVIATLNSALSKAFEDASVRQKLQDLGLEITPSTPAEMATYAENERAKWSEVIKAANITLD